MFHLGQTELIVILVVVVLLFGVGRIGKIAAELGSGIPSFKEGLNGNQDRNSDTNHCLNQNIPDIV